MQTRACVGVQGMLVSGINSAAVLNGCQFRGNAKSGALARMCGTYSATSCSSCRNAGPAYAVQGSISCAELKACEGVRISHCECSVCAVNDMFCTRSLP